MRTTAIVARVFAQFDKLLDVQVPCLQISAHGPLALATLVYRDRRIIDDFEKGHHTLRFAIGALDVSTQCAHWRPVIAQSTGKFG